MAMAASSSIAATPNPTSLAFKTPIPKPHQPFYLISNPNPSPISLSLSAKTAFQPVRSSSSSADAPLAPIPTTLKSRLAAGETLYGLFLLSASPTLAEIAGLAGYDYVVVDMENGPGGISNALPCLRALAAAHTAAVLRLPESSSSWAKKALDLGPQGLMFPMIDTPRDAELAVSYCRFPPRGVRGSAHTVVRASAYGIDDGYLSRCEDELLIMCQVESAAGVVEIEAIAGVEGVDVVQMGPLDLSASMGYLWDPGNRKVQALLKDAERRVLGAGKKAEEASGCIGGGPWLGGFAMPPHDPPEALKMRGYQMVAGAVDIGMFRKAAVEDVTSFRNVVVEIGEEGGDEDEEKAADESYWSE